MLLDHTPLLHPVRHGCDGRYGSVLLRVMLIIISLNYIRVGYHHGDRSVRLRLTGGNITSRLMLSFRLRVPHSNSVVVAGVRTTLDRTEFEV